MGAAAAGARIVMTPSPGVTLDEMNHLKAAKTIDFAAG